MANADKELLEQARERIRECVDREDTQRAKMQDDLNFCTLDQWDANIRRERENDPNGARPCLTIDKINQYIVQVVNDMRQNRPAIKIRAVDDVADPKTAEIMAGLVRHIEDRSNASVAYETAGESAVKIGLGFFRVTTEYAGDDTSNQDICLKRIPNAFSVYLGPHEMPDGSDAEFAFIFSEVSVKDFKRDYPGKKTSKDEFDDLGDQVSFWRKEDTITVCEYFYTVHEKIPPAVLSDGSQRPVTKKRIRWCKHTAIEVLEKRDWPGKYIPVVEVIGRESWVKGERILWGLVRPTKDALRMNNYWMSAITEKIGLAPKMPFVGAEGQFEGHEAKWAAANRENRAYLEYKLLDVNGNAVPPPARTQPAPMEVAMVNMTQMLKVDVKEALGMYKAAVGDSESQQSGRAILALQRESDTGTFHFADNLSRSIRHAGRIIVDLIPKIYDTRRVIRILGEDGVSETVTIDPRMQQSRMDIQDGAGNAIASIYNPGMGEYDVTVTVGPSYNTKRMEAAEAMLKITEGKPEVLQIIGDLMFKAMDWPMADKIADRFRRLLPPQLQDQNQQIPPAVQQQLQQAQAAMQAAEERIKELESGERAAMAKVQVAQQEASEKANLARQQASDEAALVKYRADLEARTKIEVAHIQANCDREAEGIKADAQRDIEFMRGANEERTEGETEGQPKGNLREVMSGMMSAMAQMTQMIAEQNARFAAMHEQTMQVVAQALSRPKQVTLRRDAEGRPTGATVQ